MVRKTLLFCLLFSVIYGQKRSPAVQHHPPQHHHPHTHQHSYPPVEEQVIEYEVPCPPPQPYPEYEPKIEKGPSGTEQVVYYQPIETVYPQNTKYENKFESKYAQYKKYYNQQYAKKPEPVYTPTDYQQYQTVYEQYPQQQAAAAPAAPVPCAVEEPAKETEKPNKKSPSIQIFLV